MKEQELRKNFSNNLAYYRKAQSMTQLDLALLLNYSDKAVSKWERGESLPDVYTLTEIARVIGVTPNDLLSERIKTVKHPKDTQAKIVISLLSVGLVWLIATTVFVILSLILKETTFDLWLIFIYAIPASAIVLIVFSSIWKNILFTWISSSSLLWTVAVSTSLTIRNTTSLNEITMIYFACIPLQVLICLWFYLKWHKIRQKKNARKRFFENTKEKKMEENTKMKQENKEN